jgi:hypothetical protein
MITSNTQNRFVTVLLVVSLIVSFSAVHAQNDTVKKNSKKSISFLDAQKKADGITIGIPEKTNPLFNLNKTKAIALKPLSYYLNLGSSNASNSPSFMSPRKVDSDVLVQRNFNGKDTSNPTLKSNTSLGTIESSTKFVKIEFRDYGLVDGDRVRIYLNQQVIDANITLKGISSFIHIPLKKGYNRIDIKALNQGRVGPNTAQFFVYDDKGGLIKKQQWNLRTGTIATLGVVRY